MIGKEIGGYGKLREIVQRDYETFSGLMLERYFHRLAAESGRWTRTGRWWDRKGENEIDMIAEDELSGKAVFYEIKRNVRHFSPKDLHAKVNSFMKATNQFNGYTLEEKSLSLEDM